MPSRILQVPIVQRHAPHAQASPVWRCLYLAAFVRDLTPCSGHRVVSDGLFLSPEGMGEAILLHGSMNYDVLGPRFVHGALHVLGRMGHRSGGFRFAK